MAQVKRLHFYEEFSGAAAFFEYFEALVGESGLDLEALMHAHAVNIAGFDSLRSYIDYLESPQNQFAHLEFAFEGEQLAEIIVHMRRQCGAQITEPKCFSRDLNAAVTYSLTSSRWGGRLFIDCVFEVVETLFLYLSESHYTDHPELLSQRDNWYGKNLFFDTSVKQIIKEYNSPEFALGIVNWLQQSAQLAFFEHNQPVAQLCELSSQIIGNGVAIALEVLMTRLRYNADLSVDDVAALRRTLQVHFDQEFQAQAATLIITQTYLSCLDCLSLGLLEEVPNDNMMDGTGIELRENHVVH
ncbi:hypothetical protein [Pseudoalteromonas umbrosa]|uniref:hypothetical protein n=1 Tax=Pseudoalteromonas umbrosa TaxID=3048489 RepID=UPI0024C289B3|nr:hypothetical protein [Pseudoalteromonas sp. B95]MDK1290062.1 hypothetical protein [Pseudoalteromonas sp. B95]